MSTRDDIENPFTNQKVPKRKEEHGKVSKTQLLKVKVIPSPKVGETIWRKRISTPTFPLDTVPTPPTITIHDYEKEELRR